MYQNKNEIAKLTVCKDTMISDKEYGIFQSLYILLWFFIDLLLIQIKETELHL